MPLPRVRSPLTVLGGVKYTLERHQIYPSIDESRHSFVSRTRRKPCCRYIIIVLSPPLFRCLLQESST